MDPLISVPTFLRPPNGAKHPETTPPEYGRVQIGGTDSVHADLDELIAEAQRNNDDLAVAIARVQEADAQARIAGAALLPSLDFGADATRQRASG